jgi:hypothetical protein
MRQINENAFLLTKSLRPISVKAMDDVDDEDGLKEYNVRRNHEYLLERSEPPRFLDPSSFEFDIALKWKSQYEFEETQRAHLEKQLEESRERLQLEIEDMYKDQKAWQLRAELAQRQEELERLERFRQIEDPRKNEKRARIDESAQLRDEEFRRQEEAFRLQQEELRRRAEARRGQMLMQQAQQAARYGNAGGFYEDHSPISSFNQYEAPVELTYGQSAVAQQAQAYYRQEQQQRQQPEVTLLFDENTAAGIGGGVRSRLDGGIETASLRNRRY